MMMQSDRTEEVWARTQGTHLCDSLLFSFMTRISSPWTPWTLWTLLYDDSFEMY